MMRFRLSPLIVGAFVLLTACTGEVQKFEAQEVEGPPEVRLDVVEQHADQFESDVPERPAGSEEEQIAAAYILGTMQQNGYFARLDSVPVADLFRSTNVIAEPEGGGEDPDAVVVVPYGTGPDSPKNSEALGLFLELSRALNVAAPGHKVQFAALGAEYSDREGGSLGSRRLARFMLDEGQDPLVVQLVEVSSVSGDGFDAVGERADEFIEIAEDLECAGKESCSLAGEEKTFRVDPDVFEEAGFDRILIKGDVQKLGPALLQFLSELGD
jgi:hypothetical protein